MSTAIRVENLSKKYTIGHEKQERYTALRDVISNKVKNVFKSAGKNTSSYTEEFFALKDVSFEIQQGDRVGIIGRNGAGKSTLLKILSRITEPTSGRISIKGRVASLLEVGTGFHPELTGRENIYLNGAILGMSRAEIRKKFDEIVAFSEVEKFLDTPVKRYSSGMYVRLAFAVAAHLEPEILIVDEVLAVGDAQFQKKCMGKMEEVSKNEGRTILFVSHNIGAITNLCNQGILLSQGTCLEFDNITKVVNKYLQLGKANNGQLFCTKLPKQGQKLQIVSIKIQDEIGNSKGEFNLCNDVYLEINYDILKEGYGYNIGFGLNNMVYGCVFNSSAYDTNPTNFKETFFKKGRYTSKILLPTSILRAGSYWINIYSTIPTIEVLDIFEKELYFDLTDISGPLAKIAEQRECCVLPILEWHTKILVEEKNLVN